MPSHEVFGDYLQAHAYKYVWCTPDQDRQMILKPAKISPIGGIWSEFRHMWRKFLPPKPVGIFHIYHIGNVHPTLLGLKNVTNKWVPVTRAMHDEKVLVDIYTGNGIQVPRCLCWYLVTRDDNLILAVERTIDPSIEVPQDIETQDIYMRLYSNAYFESQRSNHLSEPIRAGSSRPMDLAAINAIQVELGKLPKNQGAVIMYVNGKKVDEISLITVKTGDYVDWIYDASIKRIVRLDIDTMPEFNSTLDNVRKLLVHYPGATSMIDYHDDLDLFIMRVKGTASGKAEGSYIHKNDKRTIRMVTHRDYSVSVQRIHAIAAANAHIGMRAGLKLDLYIRNSGYQRPLIYENARIQEMYKLKDSQILGSMLGHNALVPEWRAEVLEANAYTAIMSKELGGISTQDVQDAYGYNSLSKLLGNTPSITRNLSTVKVIDIPEALRGRATVYEYDQYGLFIRMSIATIDETHGVSDNCAFAEVIHGIGGDSLDIQEGVNTGTIDPIYNYRFYSCGYNGGVPNEKWLDETGGGNYVATRTKFTWVPDDFRFRRVLSNKKHLAYSFKATPIDGIIEFDIAYKDSSGRTVVFKMPLGNLDLFLNNYSLIEGIDYIRNGARIVITNKEFLLNGGVGAQTVFLRYTDFAPDDFTNRYPEDRGFVWHGVLSANNKFDIRDDRVMRFVVRGQVRLKNELKFAEEGVKVSINNALNGSPYSIRDIVVPMNNYLVNPTGIDDETFVMKDKAAGIDKRVGDYMTLYKPQETTDEPSAHPNRFKVYSPFLARIFSHLRSGLLWDDLFTRPFTDQQLSEVLQPYEYLLKYDVIGRDNGWDNRYVVVHPHMEDKYISVSAYIYRVMSRAAKYYSDGLVDISNHISITEL